MTLAKAPRLANAARLATARLATARTFIGLLLAAQAYAAVTGTVTNQSTGKPQAGATVALYRLATRTGPELIAQAKSDAQGNFTINQTPQGPHLIRTAFDGVTYNHMLPPGTPTTGIPLEVYNASTEQGGAKVAKHMILFEPSPGQVQVNETYLFTNQGKTAWNDPGGGTLKFFLPAGASKPDVRAAAPGGMPLGAPVNKTSQPDVFAVDFAIKPGDTRIDITYTAPYTEGAEYAGRVVSKDENTYLIVPNGVTLAGTGLNDLGTEPRTQAHIYGLTANAYKVKMTGSVAAAPAAPAAAEARGDAAGGEDSGPRIEQIMPRVNSKTIPIMAAALGILALGFALLYRAQTTGAQETHERGRR
ncbi:MAG: hypothetical protein JWP63_6213 [Candidatus Solibacter sp.]|nr:hypothetical protein [Candidatus Solibacter sp.]